MKSNVFDDFGKGLSIGCGAVLACMIGFVILAILMFLPVTCAISTITSQTLEF